jgi:two-component system sensor histidine kinase AtoS
MTRSLSELATAADAVRGGNLTVRVPSEGPDEVGRVAEAFNAMTTSLRRTLSELSQREALAHVGGFAAELAHEVRNPLTSIKVDLQHVEEHLPEGSELRDVQRAALEGIDRLDRTVSGVLEIARSGRVVLSPVDLRTSLRAAVHAVDPIVRAMGATLRLDLPALPLVVRGDTTALEQLFTNLLANAAQAVSAGGSIDARASMDDGTTTVLIRDDGRGIPAEHLDEVREPFYSTRADGTGLGLAIADRIAAAHQAEIRIESKVGEGTSVEVRFAPATESPSDATDERVVTSRGRTPRSPDER